MRKLTRTKVMPETLVFTVIVTLLSLLIIEPAFAQGGLAPVNAMADKVLLAMRAVQVVVTAIACWMVGAEFYQKKATMESVGKIVIGAVFVAGGTEIATWAVG